MADVTLKIDAETAKAMREMTKFAQKQVEIERGVKNVGTSSRRASQDTGLLTGSLMKLAGTVGGVSALGAAFKQVLEYVGKLGTEMMELTKQTTSLVTVFPAGVSKEARQLAGATASRYGKTAGDVAGDLQAFYSKTGNTGQSVRALNELLQLQRLDPALSAESGRMAISLAMTKGMTPEQGSALVLKAGMLSEQDTATIANAAGAVDMFPSMAEGYASGNTLLSAGVKGPMLDAANRRVGKALFTDSKMTKEMGKRAKRAGLNWESMGTIERVDFINAQLPDVTPVGLQRAGLESSEEAMDLSRVLTNAGTLKNMYAGLSSVSPDLTDTRESELYSADPALKMLWDDQRYKGYGKYKEQFGPMAERAQRLQLEKSRVGAALRSMGVGYGVNEEGAPNLLGYAAIGSASAMSWMNPFPMVRMGLKYMQTEQSSSTGIDADIKRLTEAIEANTAAQRAAKSGSLLTFGGKNRE